MSTCITATAVSPICLTNVPTESEDAQALPTPLVSLITVSESGSATLGGMSEFTTPSLPPKKYLTQQLDGTLDNCSFTSASCVTPSVNGHTQSAFSGAYSYDPVTLAITNTQNRADYGNAPSACVGATLISNTAITTQNGWTSGVPITISQNTVNSLLPASNTYTGTNVCGTSNRRRSGYARASLTNRDTEANAIARSTPSGSGTSATASRTTRGAGVFTFSYVEVAYDFVCTSLLAGLSYRVSYELVTAEFGGANPVTTNHTYDFDATSDSQTFSDVLVVPEDGYQVTIQNVTIARR